MMVCLGLHMSDGKTSSPPGGKKYRKCQLYATFCLFIVCPYLSFSDLVAFLSLKEYWFKPMSPEDFRSHIGAATLCGHGRGLHHPLKYDNQLQVGVLL